MKSSADIKPKLILLAFCFMSSVLAHVSGNDQEHPFQGVPEKAKWAVTVHSKEFINWLPQNSDQKKLLEESLEKTNEFLSELAGTDVSIKAIEKATIFSESQNPDSPTGLIIKSQLNGNKVLDAFRQRLLSGKEMDESDLPKPALTKLGYQEYSVKNELSVGEIQKGTLAFSRDSRSLESVYHAAQSKLTLKQLTGLKGFQSETDSIEAQDYFVSAFFSDIQQLNKEIQTTPFLKEVESILIQIKPRNTGLDFSIWLESKNESSAELIQTSALGLKAMAMLALGSMQQEETDNPSTDDVAIAELATALGSNLKIRRSNNIVKFNLEMPGNSLDKIRNSLFEEFNGKFAKEEYQGTKF